MQVLVQATIVCALIACVCLFWAVRLRTAGAVSLAALVTLALLGRWLLSNPVPDPAEVASGPFFLPLEETWPWVRTNLVLAGAAVLCYLDARRRLDQPERIL